MALLGMLNMDNCCSMLGVADFHQASQLMALHLLYQKRAPAAEKPHGYQQLDPELQSGITKRFEVWQHNDRNANCKTRQRSDCSIALTTELA